MKKIILIAACLLGMNAGAQYVITNVPGTPGISYAWSNVAPIINANNGNFVGWLNSIGTNTTMLTSNQWIFYNSITNYISTNGPSGVTTNLQFTDGSLLSPSTNTLYFTNGVLKRVTAP